MEINDIYKCSGKKYNGEKAIISLTSWKARVATVGKTLFSLIKQCPGFHIVLVLSEEEFPKMENELPDDLMLFVKNNLIELLWVYKNYKAFKKILFTMDKYREVPVISADDDCLYTCNYAQKLYDKWLENKECVIRYTSGGRFYITQGPCTIYPPNIFKLKQCLGKIEKDILNKSEDDAFYKKILINNNTKIISFLTKTNVFPFIFHDENMALHNQRGKEIYKNAYLE